MLEFFRVLFAATFCHCRSDPLSRGKRRKHRNVSLSQCQIKERVREGTEKGRNDQEIYRFKDIQKSNRTEANQFDCKGELDEHYSSHEKLPLPDKSTTRFVQMTSFGTQTTEEWKFKTGKTIVSKATQTPLFTAYYGEISGKSKSEESLKHQAWKDAKFFVTNQLLAQCFHTSNGSEALHLAGN